MNNSDLFDKYITNELTSRETKQLEQFLQDDANGEEFINYLIETSLIVKQAELQRTPSVDHAKLNDVANTTKSFISLKILSLAACLLIAMSVFFFGINNHVAEQKNSFQVQYLNSKNLEDSFPIDKQWHELKTLSLEKGSLEFITRQGNHIVLEGPAELDTQSEEFFQLKKGKIWVNVANIDKFVIETPYGQVTDLGTAFGVSLQNGRSHVHVFEGHVQIGPDNKSLFAGQAASFNKTGSQLIPFEPQAFKTNLKDYKPHVLGEEKEFTYNQTKYQTAHPLQFGEILRIPTKGNAQKISGSLLCKNNNSSLNKDISYRLVISSDGKPLYRSEVISCLNSNSPLVFEVDNLGNTQNLSIRAELIKGANFDSHLILADAKIHSCAPVKLTQILNYKSQWNYWIKPLTSKAWTKHNFDDKKWPKGQTLIGYGDPEIITNIRPEDYKPITVYFRKSFRVDKLHEISSVQLSLLVDDGAIIYLNGEQLIRTNLPSGSIHYSTEPLKQLYRETEYSFTTFDIPKSMLHNGDNTIAIEVHSFERSTDLKLEAAINAFCH